jgi:hypothetical protein
MVTLGIPSTAESVKVRQLYHNDYIFLGIVVRTAVSFPLPDDPDTFC